MVKDCPLIKIEEQAKVYAIKEEQSTSENMKGKGVLEGALMTNGIFVQVLFDTRGCL